MEQATETTSTRVTWPRRLFGTYDRRSDLNQLQSEPSRWNKPVAGAKAWATIIVAVITVCGTVITKSIDSRPAVAMAVRDTSPSQTVVRLGIAERRIDALERGLATNLYISCELLRRSQPAALPPRECSDDEQRIRRGK